MKKVNDNKSYSVMIIFISYAKQGILYLVFVCLFVYLSVC